MTCTHSIIKYFSPNYVFFILKVRNCNIKCEYVCQRKKVPIVTNRGKSKSSHKEMQRQVKTAFVISDEWKMGINYPDLEPGNEFWNRVRTVHRHWLQVKTKC